jgi:hypothetical protein
MASSLDKLFGGKGSADKARKSMHKTYGKEDGEHVFRATVAKRKRKSSKRNPASRFLGL